jgi:hypothetical protein
LNVRVGGSELLPELIGSKPPVVARGGLDLLLLEQILQSGLLVGTALQNELHAIHRQIRRRGALIVLGERERVSVSRKGDQSSRVDSIRNPRGDRIALRGGG